MSVAFFGFQAWGLASLRAIVEAGWTVPLVVTHPDAEDPHHQHFVESVASYAEAVGLRVLVKKTVDDEVVDAVRRAAPKYLVSSNWRRIIPSGVLDSIRGGAFNVHRSLLPKYAGLAPINWAIANGESRLGVTIHLISEEVDLGAVVAQESFDIGPDDTATEAFHRTNPIVARLIVSALQDGQNGTLAPLPSPRDAAEFFHLRGDVELRIRWSDPRARVYNLIRAQSDPFANAWGRLGSRRLHVKTARLSQVCHRGTPGRVVQKTREGHAVVLCGTGGADPCQGLELRSVSLDDGVARPPAEVLEIGQYLD